MTHRLSFMIWRDFGFLDRADIVGPLRETCGSHILRIRYYIYVTISIFIFIYGGGVVVP